MALSPAEIDAKRLELERISTELGKMAERPAKDIKIAEAKQLKDQADAISRDLQEAFSSFIQA